MRELYCHAIIQNRRNRCKSRRVASCANVTSKSLNVRNPTARVIEKRVSRYAIDDIAIRERHAQQRRTRSLLIDETTVIASTVLKQYGFMR